MVWGENSPLCFQESPHYPSRSVCKTRTGGTSSRCSSIQKGVEIFIASDFLKVHTAFQRHLNIHVVPYMFCQSTADSKQLQIPLPPTPPGPQLLAVAMGQGQCTFKNGGAALFEIAKLLSFMLSGSPPVPWIYLTHMMQLCGRDREGLCIPPVGWYEFVSKSVPYDPPHMVGVWPIHL